jgi:hypothetical protein
MQASIILDQVTDILQDKTNIRWTEAELIRSLNDGQRAIVLLRPDSSAQNAAVQLVAGTKQAIPATGLRLLDVVRNMGTNGAVPGRAIRIVQREVLDAQIPDWHTQTATVVKHYMLDNRDPRRFYVYPAIPANSLAFLEIVYSSNPRDVTSAADNISVDDIYAPALVNYVVFRAYSKDAEYTADGGAAQLHYTAFLKLLGDKTATDTMMAPQANATAFNPNIPKNANMPALGG